MSDAWLRGAALPSALFGARRDAAGRWRAGRGRARLAALLGALLALLSMPSTAAVSAGPIGSAAGGPGVRAALRQEVAAAPAKPAEDELQSGAERLARLGWAPLLSFHRRLSFSAAGSRRALDALLGQGSELDRAAAHFALGAGGLVSEEQRLLQVAERGAPAERLAALFALGELPVVPAQFLVQRALLRPGLEGSAALLALLIGEARLEPGLLETLLTAAPELAPRLTALRRALAAPELAAPTPVLAAYLGVRYEAAKRFGYIDRQSYAALRAAELSQDLAFLENLVLFESAASGYPGVEDLLLERLLSSGSAACLEAALKALPEGLDALVGNGLWLPKDDREREALLSLLERRGASLEHTQILAYLLAQPPLRTRAAALALQLDPEGRSSGAFDLLEPLLKAGELEERVRAVLALARSGFEGWVPELERLDLDGEPRVRLAAQAARLALGDDRGLEPLLELLAAPDEPLWAAAIEDLCHLARSGRVASLLIETLPELEGPEALAVALALAEVGRSEGREVLMAALEDGSAGSLAPNCVEALALQAGAAEVALFERLFPDDQDAELNRALGRALIELDLPSGRRFLRAALWQGDFSLGVLAAAALARGHGLPALYDELDSPPSAARPADLRRLGFAIGMLGGLGELERISTNRPSSDPSVQGAYLGALTNRTR
jgi:hypothetical protein